MTYALSGRLDLQSFLGDQLFRSGLLLSASVCDVVTQGVGLIPLRATVV